MYMRAFVYFPFIVSMMAVGLDLLTPIPVGVPNFRSVAGGFMPIAFFGLAALLNYLLGKIDKLEARVSAIEGTHS